MTDNFFVAFRARATRTVRTLVDPISVRDHAPQLLLIGLVGYDALTELPLPLFGFGSQDMPRKGMTANHFARTGFLEALRRALVCFQLRHKMSWISYRSFKCSIIPDCLSTPRTRPFESLRACPRSILRGRRRSPRAR